MSLQGLILQENSKNNWNEVGNFILKNPEKFNELIEIVLQNDGRLSRLASQIMTNLADASPEIFTKKHLQRLIKNLQKTKDFAIVRNSVRLFQFIDVPVESEGEFFNQVLGYLKNADVPIAVKAFSMTSLRKICEKYPELSGELIPLIEILIEEKVSPGIVNRGKQELIHLRKLSK